MWEERKHPRDESGQFTSGSGSASKKTTKSEHPQDDSERIENLKKWMKKSTDEYNKRADKEKNDVVGYLQDEGYDIQKVFKNAEDGKDFAIVKLPNGTYQNFYGTGYDSASGFKTLEEAETFMQKHRPSADLSNVDKEAEELLKARKLLNF